MSFSFGSGIIGNKLRQQMYLKHLRQVQKINNRQADGLRKNLKQYKSITQIHKRNKVRAHRFRISQEKKVLDEKNKEIQKKINSIGSDQEIKKSQEKYRYWESGGQTVRTDLHYQYRKKQQERISEGNKKLMTSILHQKSTILPQIAKKAEKNEQLNRSGRLKNSETDI